MGKDEEGREEEVWYCKKLLEASRDGELQVVTSTLTVAEAYHIGDRNDISEDAKKLFKGMLTSGKGGVVLIETSIFVSSKARDLFWDGDAKIKKAPDRIHLASAIESGCQEFYTTDNKDLIKKSEKIKRKYGLTISYASKTTVLPGHYLQERIKVERSNKGDIKNE